MYMSYCRFEGTRAEMRACIDVVEDHINEEAEYEVSENEIDQFRSIVNDMVTFLRENDIIDYDTEVDENALEKVCESMRHCWKEEY